jgi:TolB-like protein/class 3 adenylate cyclase/Flp pilus assembly protein TadD
MANEGFKRKLAAILSADVEGYSRLMDDDEEATVRTLTTYRTAINDLVQQYRGRVVDNPGDNILAEFTSVVDAVNCAVEIQRDLAEKNAELPYKRKMEFRIGVNLGDVIEEEDRIYGDGINIAARVEGLAEAGGICISGRAYDQVENKLGLEYENLGEHQVKNITRPISVYRVLSYPGAAAHRVVQAKAAVGKRWRKIAIAGGAVALAAVIVAGIWQFYQRQSERVEPASVENMAFSLPDKPSIAVLPFDNLSGNPEDEFIADGISESIITALSKTPKMFVIARNSTFTYKSKPVKVQEVAEDLSVRYVLEGSLQKSDDQLRINAQLIDAIAGNHLWAEKYDRNINDIFVLQDDITMKIITALQVKLSHGERANIIARGTDNLEAYLKVLQGMQHYQRVNREGDAIAQKLAKEAILLDPDYPAAYYLLSRTQMREVLFGTTKSPEMSLKLSIENAKKAISLDDSFADAQALLGWLYTMTRQHDKGIAAAERALALDPNSVHAYTCLGLTLNYAGRHEQAIEIYKKGIRISPIPSVNALFCLCVACRDCGRYEEGIAAAKKAVQLSPNSLYAHTCLASCYALSGRNAEAKAEAAEVLRVDPNISLVNLGRQLPYKDPAVLEMVIESLRKAGLK